jgi:predicted dehydrogenase
LDNARKIRLAVIGCGAVARIYHLPSIIASDRFVLIALVDSHLPNAQKLGEEYGVLTTVEDYEAIAGQIDAAIVALPNYLHATVSTDLLRRGIHVLVEKPMALSSSECETMIRAASDAGAVLAVGMDFRFIRAFQFVRQILDQGWLGDIISFDIRQGVILNWAISSDYLLKKERAGGGVLFDFGPHILDLMLWWFGDYERVEYYDDAAGGLEANCELRLVMQSGVRGTVELSRMRTLSNTCTIRGSNGTLEVGIWDPNPRVQLKIAGSDLGLDGTVTDAGIPDQRFRDVFCRQLDDFAEAIRNRREPFVPGREGKRYIVLIEACYTVKKLLSHAWDSPTMPSV